MKTSISKGTIATNEYENICGPRLNILPTLGCLYAHGAEGAPGSYAWMNIPSRWPIMRAGCADRVMLAGDIGGNETWGNDTSIARLNSAYSVLQSVPSVLPGKVHVLAQSMGAASSLSWVAQNKSKVASVTLVIPVINVEDIWANSNYHSTIDAAYAEYGGYVPSRDNPIHSPLTMAQMGKFADVPILMMYGDSDSLCKPQYSQAFAAACNMCTAVPISGGHTEEIQNLMDPNMVRQFMREHS